MSGDGRAGRGRPRRRRPDKGEPGSSPAAQGGDAGNGKAFEIVRELAVEGSPARLWAALTTGTGGWLWPVEYEPREGGAAPSGGTVTHWDPPHRLTARVEDPDGIPGQTLDELDHVIEPRDGGRRSWLRHVHSGIFTGDWDARYDGVVKHTDFHLHTLGQYMAYFEGRPVAYSALHGPPASTAPDAFARLARALGLPDDATDGARVRVQAAGGELDAVIDFRSRYFIGLRADETLHRFYGRNHFGAPVGISVHDFGAHADAKGTELAWQDWLDHLYG
ncbi:SRPBCC family protein [Streptomyces sp. Je 1-369]|uniref:SRPBCC family protein n=1 Tax=Streptomyces sp. Je 1-369 TaxID=2966192 RepID=UPI00228654E1|nr:SRPBCC domain-containing protein [Streptomyces sp. Je 1-369]WAL94797.1 SRPBCC domain-containing protein [Streptomyces sp. Je 1-369]